MSPLNAFLEPIAFIVRAGPQSLQYGDPYDCAVIATVEGRMATLRALGGSGFTQQHARAIIRVIKLAGYKVRWERKINGMREVNA